MGSNKTHRLSDLALHRTQGCARWLLTAAVLLCTAPLHTWADAPQTPNPDRQSTRPPISSRRIVKHFDFDEKPLNNFGTVPMSWRRHGGRGFPLFLEGKFDEQVGHDASPSFRFDLDGGSLAYHYEGRDVAIRANSDYLIVLWIKTDALDAARAYFTAYLLDRKGKMIPGTERSSRLVGGTNAPADWEPITVSLAGNVPGARYIGLSLWLTQERIWNTQPKPMRHIEREDVKATAWFDDLTIYRLPLVTLNTSNPGNVFGPHERITLNTLVNDPDGLNLQADLVVKSADGQFVDKRKVLIRSNEADPVDKITYNNLGVGLYDAKLTVWAGDTPLVWRSLRFARVAPRLSSPVTTGRKFGVVLQDIDADLLAGQREVLKQLWTEHVKLPVWFAQQAVMNRSATLSETINRYLKTIVDANAEPIGILTNDPPEEGPGPRSTIRSMLDILSEDPLTWKPLIATTWSHHSGLIHVWQVGHDTDDTVFLDDRLGPLIPVLRHEMEALMAEPTLATASSTTYKSDPARCADYLAISLPAAVRTDDIEEHIKPIIGQEPQRYWVTVEALPENIYPRTVRLADLARRLAETAFQNVGSVFLAAPWSGGTDGIRAQVNPCEDYLILRTVADILGAATPISRTTLDGQAQCLVFDRNGEAILAVWDEYAPPTGRDHFVYLGERTRQIDIWGRPMPVKTVGNRQRVRIGPVPTFIVNTPTWLMEWRRQFVLAPSLLEACLEKNDHELAFTNTFHEPVTGIVRLYVPDGWEVRPTKFPFALQPGETFHGTVAVRFPINAEASVRPLVGAFVLDANRRYKLLIPAWFELGLKQIDIDTFVWRQDNRVVVRHSMTNRTKRTINFEGYLIPPRQQRLSRLFVNFQPGQSLTKDYVLGNGLELAGQQVRVGLKEIDGSRVWNRILDIP